MHVTLQQIARECDVSVQTVSSILNQKGHLYRAQTRQRVQATAERLGYRPNVLARGLRGGRTQTLGLIVPGLNSGTITNAKLQSIERAAQARGYRVLIASYEADAARMLDHLRDFIGLAVDGLVCWGATESDQQIIAQARKARTPLVVIEPAEALGVPAVNVDRQWGGYLQVQHLYEIGRRKLAGLFTTSASSRTLDKVRGIEQAAAERGLELDPALFLSRQTITHSPPETGVQLVRQLLDAGRSFDALLTLSDGVALGAMTELLRQGVRVPEDIAVIGFDDDIFANYCIVPLTTIHQPRNLGDDALDLLLAQIKAASEPGSAPTVGDGADGGAAPVRVLKPHLVVRASTVASG